MVVFPPIFVSDTKIISGYNFVIAPLTSNVENVPKHLDTSNSKRLGHVHFQIFTFHNDFKYTG